jgi:hypothetical protein
VPIPEHREERPGGLPPIRIAPLFAERRAVPWWWWVLAIVIVVPSIEAVVVLGPEMATRAGWLTGGITLAATLAVIGFVFGTLSSLGVTVSDDGVLAGKSLLPASAIGRVRQLDAVAARRLLGRDARVDAHLSIRPWITTAVQIEVVDDLDSTPYWIVGTRRPAELVGVLHTLRSTSGGDARTSTPHIFPF